MLTSADEMEQALESQESERPVLHGEPIDGSAFDEYKLAAGLVSDAANDDWIACRNATLNGDKCATDLREELVAQHSEMLAALERGAQSASGKFTVKWKAGFEIEVPKLMANRTVVNIAVLAADQHLDKGRADLAVNALLDAMQLGRDLMESPILSNEMIGAALLYIASRDALIDGGLLEKIPSSELARLERAMGELDLGISLKTQAREGEILGLIRGFQRVESGELDGKDDFGSDVLGMTLNHAKYGFSSRAVITEHFQHASNSAAALDLLPTEPWADWHAEQEALHRATTESRNPLTTFFAVNWASVELTRRRIITLLRLTRIAASYAAHGELSNLRDPFGTQFLVSNVSDKLRVESARAAQTMRPDRLAVEILRRDR